MSKFKDLFVKSDEPKEQQQPVASAPVEQQVNIPASAFMRPDYTPEQKADNSSTPSPELVAKIWDTLLSKNFPGPDYLELKGHCTALEQFMPDYTQRLLAAFNLLKNQYPNFSVKVVTDSIDGYISIVKDEQADGENECNRIYGEKLKEKQDAFESVTAEIEQLQNEIAEKNRILSERMQEKGTLQQEVLHAQNEMDHQSKVFADSVNTVLAVLESDKKTISKLNV